MQRPPSQSQRVLLMRAGTVLLLSAGMPQIKIACDRVEMRFLWFERRVELSNFKVNLHNIASLYDTLLLSNKRVQTFATMLHFEAL
jgi:hypothetical protein